MKSHGSMMGLGIAVGVGIGSIRGIAIQNVAIGIAIGIAIGAAGAGYLEHRSR